MFRIFKLQWKRKLLKYKENFQFNYKEKQIRKAINPQKLTKNKNIL